MANQEIADEVTFAKQTFSFIALTHNFHNTFVTPVSGIDTHPDNESAIAHGAEQGAFISWLAKRTFEKSREEANDCIKALGGLPLKVFKPGESPQTKIIDDWDGVDPDDPSRSLVQLRGEKGLSSILLRVAPDQLMSLAVPSMPFRTAIIEMPNRTPFPVTGSEAA